MTLDDLKADKALSFWLKEQIEKISERDILDAINDAELLLGALAGRFKIMTGAELYQDGLLSVPLIHCDSHTNL